LWATDGSVQVTKQQLGNIYYATTSRRLAEDLAQLLLRFNVHARIRRVSKDGYRDCFHVSVESTANQLRFLEEIGVHGARGYRAEELQTLLLQVEGRARQDTIPVAVWDRVRDALQKQDMTPAALATAMGRSRAGHMMELAPSRERMGQVAAILDDAELDVIATNDVHWDAIVKIEPIGEQSVYDGTVLGTHNFIANSIALHNSLEQDADMVILLHRDDVYEKESTRPGEADLIVAKHRNGPTRDLTVAFQGHYSRFVDMAH
jgi:replicative DNA helicase